MQYKFNNNNFEKPNLRYITLSIYLSLLAFNLGKLLHYFETCFGSLLENDLNV